MGAFQWAAAGELRQLSVALALDSLARFHDAAVVQLAWALIALCLLSCPHKALAAWRMPMALTP